MKAIDKAIRLDMERFSLNIKELAPKNSKYIGLSNYKIVDFIHVDGKRVRTNSNRLYESINMVVKSDTKNRTVYQVGSFGDLPYYDDAVLKQTIEVAYHFGRSEYGDIRYNGSKIVHRPNRNYLYYMKGINEMRSLIGKWNNQVIKTEESIGEYL